MDHDPDAMRILELMRQMVVGLGSTQGVHNAIIIVQMDGDPANATVLHHVYLCQAEAHVAAFMEVLKDMPAYLREGLRAMGQMPDPVPPSGKSH